ncbi:MAG TPA: cytochrome c oxidase assembly protein [Acidimicrobiales bacterium]|nr:cytochrome c oxidase assembly protein [Acidimicrobiales bacterium]
MILAHGDPGDWPLDFHLHPDVLVVVGLVAVGDWLALTRLGPQLAPAGTSPYSRRQVGLLGAGVATLLVFSEWPVHDLAEGYLYSVHMIQHSAYTLLVPPLFILGTPAWLWRRLTRPVMRAFRLLTRPLAAVSIFSAVTVVTHLPPVVTAAVRSEPAHFGLHLLLVVSAVLMWWPLLGPLPEAPRLTAPVHRMLYIFGQSLVPAVVGSALIWTTSVPYRVYETFPPVWGIDDLADQQWAGVIMEIIEGLVLVGLMVVVFLPLVKGELRAPSPTMDRLGRTADEEPTALRR